MKYYAPARIEKYCGTSEEYEKRCRDFTKATPGMSLAKHALSWLSKV